ncbi:hypothetical protein ACTM9W_12130 [Clostridium sp. HCP1S3_A12]|uniref:hypothetical protein n=1 Tax=unclassified Clostridium TaxID=2614128 RepID=UPI002A96B092|nr:hypothetical protein [Clostridium sp.]MDY5930315.1 hypothetical protein [Candidatus Onthovivens sp.]
MEPINIFIDGICIAGVTLEKSGVDFPVIDIVRDGNYITSYSPDQHILHFFMENKEEGKSYYLASKRVWE